MKKSEVINTIAEVLEEIAYSKIANKYAEKVLQALEDNYMLIPPNYIKEVNDMDWVEAQGWEPEERFGE